MNFSIPSLHFQTFVGKMKLYASACQVDLNLIGHTKITFVAGLTFFYVKDELIR